MKSVHVLVQDETKNVTRTVASDDFAAAIGCSGLTLNDKISNGVIVLISSARFDYNFKGNTMRVVVTVCTKDKQEGICTTKRDQAGTLISQSRRNAKLQRGV